MIEMESKRSSQAAPADIATATNSSTTGEYNGYAVLERSNKRLKLTTIAAVADRCADAMVVVDGGINKARAVGNNGNDTPYSHYQEHCTADAAVVCCRASRLPCQRPLARLSISLHETHQKIAWTMKANDTASRGDNDVAVTVTNVLTMASRVRGGGSLAVDESDRRHKGWDGTTFSVGEVLHSRYRIKETLGMGSFGLVVLAEDINSADDGDDDDDDGNDVAIKIIKSGEAYRQQAQVEIELLTRIRQLDPHDEHHIVRLQTHFVHGNHQCLVFELLSISLYDMLRNTKFQGVSLTLTQKLGRQLARALDFLSNVGIIHCDLKPDNIVLCHCKKSDIKVVDFGSSCRINKCLYKYIQTRCYRAPEVLLQLDYGPAIDMWSLGCILVELYTGVPLFVGHDECDQMARIVHVLGLPPFDMLQESHCSLSLRLFEKVRLTTDSLGHVWQLKQRKRLLSCTGTEPNAKQRATAATMESISLDPRASLKAIIMKGDKGVLKQRYDIAIPAHEMNAKYDQLVDLVYRMLAYRPEDRITPQEAMRHPFLA